MSGQSANFQKGADAQGAILRCNEQGNVVKLENQGLFDTSLPVEGHLFSTLFDTASVEKALAAMMALAKGDTVFAEEINIQTGPTECRTVFLSGYREQDARVFLLSPAPEELFDLYAELMQINNEQANFIRVLSKQQQAIPAEKLEDDIYQEISALNNELANAQRELAKKNMALEGLNAELKELNAEKDKFFSIIAHDLKSPFNAILGFSSLLAMDAQSMERDEIEQSARTIHESGQKAFRLLENLLDWARIQMGRVRTTPTLFDLSDVVQRSLDALGGAADAKKIDLSSKVSDQRAYADLNMIDTVIRNLVNNAIKFTPEGGTVTIDAEENGSSVVVRISDTGVGIPTERLASIFKMSEATSTRGTVGEGGTGLGLLLCKEFIERNNGEISVDSTQGAGSIFSFNLPVAPQ